MVIFHSYVSLPEGIYYPYAPWCWYIYLQNWVILGANGQVNIPAPWSIWVRKPSILPILRIIEAYILPSGYLT